MRSRRRGPGLLVLGVVLAGLSAACGERHETREITETRTVRAARRIPPMAPFDDSVRFGFARSPGSPLRWVLPAGWSVGPARPMRLASFRVETRPKIDVSLTVLSAEEVSALPRTEGHGRRSPRVEATGDGTALLGVLVELGNECLYLKMTGPAGAVTAERANFLRLHASLEAGR